MYQVEFTIFPQSSTALSGVFGAVALGRRIWVGGRELGVSEVVRVGQLAMFWYITEPMRLIFTALYPAVALVQDLRLASIRSCTRQTGR